MSRVVVAGGGIIGLCTAYYLKKAGHDVLIIDRGDLKSGTSFGNAGYVSPSHFIPLASPGIIAKGMKWMMSSSSPFYIKPRLNIDLIRWGLTFWKRSGRSTMERNIPHLDAILQLSRTLTSEIRDELGDNFRMKEMGCLMLYKSLNTEHHEIELAKEAAALNIDTRVLNLQELQAMEPEVELNVRGGVLYPIDCHLHPGDLMTTITEYLKNTGVEFSLNTNIIGFEKESKTLKGIVTDKGVFRGDEYVLATGSWLPIVSKQLGIDILMQAGKGYSMTFENVKRNLHYPAILVDDRVAMTPMGADLRMGGTMEISGIGSPLLMKRVKSIFNAAKNYYPNLPVEFPEREKIWYGLRPLSPDGLPYIGRHSAYTNLVISGGHAMLGISLAAASGKLVEEIIGHKKTSIDIAAFDVER